MRPLTTLTANLSASLVLGFGLGLGGCDRLPDEDWEHYLDRHLETSESTSAKKPESIPTLPTPSSVQNPPTANTTQRPPVAIHCNNRFNTPNLWSDFTDTLSVQFHMIGHRDRPEYFQPTIKRALGLNPGEYLPGVTISVFAENENYSNPFGKIEIQFPENADERRRLVICGELAIRNSQGEIIRYISLDDMYNHMRTTLPTFLSWRGSHSITVSNF